MIPSHNTAHAACRPSPIGRPWTKYDDRRLREWRTEGLSYSKCARKLKRGLYSVTERWQFIQKYHPMPDPLLHAQLRTGQLGFDVDPVALATLRKRHEVEA